MTRWKTSQVVNRALPGAEGTSITLVRGGRPATAAYVGQLAMDADEMQYQRGYGRAWTPPGEC